MSREPCSDPRVPSALLSLYTMDIEQPNSFVSASAGVEDTTTHTHADAGAAVTHSASEPRSPSAASTATERPADHLPSPTKPPSIDSNLSSVQGKTAGTPPDHDHGADADETVSSIWDESVDNKTPTPQASSAPVAAIRASSSAPHPTSVSSNTRPDWMTDDLDESWPDEGLAVETTTSRLDANHYAAANSNSLTVSTAARPASESAQPDPPLSPTRSAASSRALATPSMSSRPPVSAFDPTALPNPAFSAARHQARRALLKSRLSAAAAPTPKAPPVSSNLQAGRSTPSLRLPSHQNRRHRRGQPEAENQEGDSTIWSESESNSDSASNDSAPDDFESARGSLAENSRITNMQTAQHSRAVSQTQDPQSPASASNASAAQGTFIHKADASSLPPVLRPVWQSPAKAQGVQNRKGIAALGGDMFTPMKLQSMFKTPTPPEKPVRNASALNPFTMPDPPAPNKKSEITETQEVVVQSDRSVQAQGDQLAASTSVTPLPPQQGAVQMHPLSNLGIGVPSTPFTFQSPRAPMQDRLQVSRGIVPSQSLHNMQTLHPSGLQATALARPASAAADLGLLTGSPTPHTPMRLFKFNYDDAITRARLEDMVNERTPVAATQPVKAAEVERERKRLRLDVRPRKVLTGDLMSMPALSSANTRHPASNTRPVEDSASKRQPVVDYVKESAEFMSALQNAVRVPSTGPDTSPEWATEEEESSGNGLQEEQQMSFHRGKVDASPNASVTSPARRRRRSIGLGHKKRPSQQSTTSRQEVAPSANEHRSPERLSSRRLPLDSSFITESSSNEIPMSSTLKSRASLSSRIAALSKEIESPRKLLRRISAAAIAEDEVQEEFDNQEAEPGKNWRPYKFAEEAVAYRDDQIRRLEERIARRRQLYTPARPSEADQALAEDDPQTVQRPQLITLHEPTLDIIASQRRSHVNHGSRDDSDLDDDSGMTDNFVAQNGQDGNTRRFQDGIVLYDSERIPDPPLPDPSRVLRNIASAVELRNTEADRNTMARASSLLALPAQSTVDTVGDEVADHQAKRGDRTTSSNTLVDPSNARTLSGDVGSQLAISDLGGKGATITRTGSLFNISQIPEQEIESLGRGKLTFNKELHRWEKVPRSRSSQEDLRSAASSRNDVLDARPTSRTPIPAIPEASAELSRSLDVFSESTEEQQAREQLGARTNSFQQRLASNNLSNADGRLSDSSDPFRDFESFGQSSHAPVSLSDAVDEANESTPRPVKSKTLVSKHDSRQLHGATQALTSQQPAKGSLTISDAAAQNEALEPSMQVSAPNTAQPPSATPRKLVPRPLPTSTVPRSGSSLRNVVTYSPESTASSHQSGLGQLETDGRDEQSVQRSESPNYNILTDQAQPSSSKRPRDNANPNVFATPDRRAAHQHLGTPTPRASTCSISTPKSILKQPAVGRTDVPGRLHGATHNISHHSGTGGGTPNRTISFADPPSATRMRDQGLTLLSRGGGAAAGQRARATLGAEKEEDAGSEDERTQAISSALKMLADLTLGDESGTLASKALTASKMRDLDANRSHWSYHTLRRPRKSQHPTGDDDDDHSWRQDEETYDEVHGYPDMTLLTDASFNYAHDKVLEAITDVEPWEPGWDELQAIDLSRRRLESCVRLKEFLPLLEEVDLQTNELSYLTGVPSSVRVLNVAHNRLTSMASFGHLLHLEVLDISGNQIDSLTHLSCLKHLHTLKADANAISSLAGIDKIRSLTHVSLSGNRLKGINLATTQWAGLETLDASHNQLISIRGLSLMRRLKSLNLDHNDLSMVDLSPSMPKLRLLRVSGNTHLQTLDVAPAKRLRTLYADYCDLDCIHNLDQLEVLDNLSMRQQAEAAITWPANQLRDVRRLFLSGNAFPHGISTAGTAMEVHKPIATLAAQAPLVQPLRFLNLVYLELSACQLMQLPADLAQVAPNLRSLNLDHNLISTLPSLEQMQRLKRLSLVGCRVKKSKSIIVAVRGLAELQVLDCRTNPCTLGLYAPVIAPSTLPTHRGQDDTADTEALAASWLPPVPNAQIVQPDLAASERRREAAIQRAQIEQLEKSHFHRRRAPLADYAIDPNATLARNALDKETARRAAKDGASYSNLSHAADARFVKTLPKQFYERRVLHRGLLAMACPKLSWIDGLAVAEEEIEEADALVQSHRFDRTPVA